MNSSSDLASRFAVLPTRDGCDRLLLRIVQSVAGMEHTPSVERWVLVRRAVDEHAAAVSNLWHNDTEGRPLTH